MIRKLKIIVAERSSVVRPQRLKVRVEVPPPFRKIHEKFCRTRVRRSVREISHLCSQKHIIVAERSYWDNTPYANKRLTVPPSAKAREKKKS